MISNRSLKKIEQEEAETTEELLENVSESDVPETLI